MSTRPRSRGNECMGSLTDELLVHNLTDTTFFGSINGSFWSLAVECRYISRWSFCLPVRLRPSSLTLICHPRTPGTLAETARFARALLLFRVSHSSAAYTRVHIHLVSIGNQASCSASRLGYPVFLFLIFVVGWVYVLAENWLRPSNIGQEPWRSGSLAPMASATESMRRPCDGCNPDLD
jgi:hypothetical protein